MAKEEVTEVQETEGETLRMCKGQMPSPLVWFIRFHEVGENASAIARKYFTTPGKIVDIQKANNQKYITENMKWSDEDLDAAAEQIKANFVRGQEQNERTPGSVNTRGLATTEKGDEQYSLDKLEEIRDMKFAKDATSIAEARAAWNKENPRKPREGAEQGETQSPESDEGAESEDDLDDLVD